MKLIDIRFTRIETNQTDGLIETYRSCFSDGFLHRVNRYLKWQDRAARLAGRLLLLAALKDRGHASSGPIDLEYDSHGRPYLASSPLDFNISHSNEYVVCALAGAARIGIDLEYVNAINLADFKEQFTEEEWFAITDAPDPVRRFYHYWTVKECALKADGRGLTLPLSQTIFQNGRMTIDRREWFIEEIKLARDYSCHLAVDTDDYQLFLRKMVF